MRAWWAAALTVILGAATAAAQEGSVQLSAATQIVTASDTRRAGQQPLESDLGFTVYEPASRFGNLFIDLHAVRRDNGVRLGATVVGLRDVKFWDMTWSFSGGDNAFAPPLSTYAFTNLFAPQVTFAGGSLAGFNPRGSLALTVGRVTVIRNIFGTDPQSLEQGVGQFQAKFRPRAHVEVIAHGSHVSTGNTAPYTSYVQKGSDAGGGVRVRPVATVELSADAGLSRFQRHGSSDTEQNVTALAGAKWTLSRGWLEVNASRFSPGYFAVVNTPFLDRQGAFAAGELEVASPLRLFGGLDVYRTNLEPEAAADASVAVPRGLAQRAFGGVRLHIGGRSFLTLRTEQGDRSAKPTGRPGTVYDTDTGSTAAEFQTNVRDVSAFARYERRENVDRANAIGTYSQQTASGQILGHVSRGLQLFGSAMVVQQDRAAGGQTFWQGGGGMQMQLPKRQLWVRAEGLFSRTDERTLEIDLPHALYTLGVTGQLTRRTAIALDVMLDRAPQLAGPSDPWLTRSMIRLTHRVPTGSARVSSGTRPAARRRGTANIFGIAFVDWNGNGLMDPGDQPLAGVPFRYAEAATSVLFGTDSASVVKVTSGSDGQFAFVNVPEGRAQISVDLAALPVDFDAPDPSVRDTEARGKPREKLAFGLVPLGSVTGLVLHDADHDGEAGSADTPVEGAVLVLDDGARSEQTRGGLYRFDAVRAGAHSLKLLSDSLPDGSSVLGAWAAEVTLDRAQLTRSVNFLVRMEKRPEIRKVFPPKVIARRPPDVPALGTPVGAGASPTRTAPSGTPRPAEPPAHPPVSARATRSVGVSPTRGPKVQPWYAIQLAATSDRHRAWELIRALQADGVDAYLSEDADGLAKVRVGSYRTRAEALRDLARLRPPMTGWITQIGG